MRVSLPHNAFPPKTFIETKKPNYQGFLLRQLGHLLFNNKTRRFPHPPHEGAGFVANKLIMCL
jgi:hypothetical protein